MHAFDVSVQSIASDRRDKYTNGDRCHESVVYHLLEISERRGGKFFSRSLIRLFFDFLRLASCPCRVVACSHSKKADRESSVSPTRMKVGFGERRNREITGHADRSDSILENINDFPSLAHSVRDGSCFLVRDVGTMHQSAR